MAAPPTAAPAPGGGGTDGPVVGRLDEHVPATGESFHSLGTLAGVRVEHIVSSDSPDPAPQRQAWDEWVLVVAGAAELDVAGASVPLAAGDWILLPAGTPHRVLRATAGTHWIAVHGPAQSADRP